ncbi:MAG: NAD(P)-dependent oxidoreductase [Planctomycetota bacterium]
MTTRPIVIQTEHLSEAAAGWLAERADLVVAAPGTPAFDDAAPVAQGLVIRTYTAVDEALLARLPALRAVGRAGVGLDNVDTQACARRGVRVFNTPDANTQAVVEYVTCLVCDALRPRAFLDAAVSRARWDELRAEVVAHRQMSELRLGILGLGRIGRRVAQVMRAIGFDAVFNDSAAIPQEHWNGARPVGVEELFESSDVISVHVDGRASNRGFVSAALIARMRADAVFINTSRGFVVDHRALAGALRANPGMLALLDVHDPEPVAADNPLLGLANAHLAPHLASRTDAAMEAMSWVVRDVWDAIRG